MLRIRFMQQWFELSAPAMEEVLFDVPPYREFAAMDDGNDRFPDESTILRFRHLLETHKLAVPMLATVTDVLRDKALMLRISSVVDATLISAPSTTKNDSVQRDPGMHQTKKGNIRPFGMKAHIGVDAQSGLVHTVKGTAAKVNDVVEGNGLLHGDETNVFVDASYQGAHKRSDAKEVVTWHVAMRPGKRKALTKSMKLGALTDDIQRLNASIRAKVKHSFRVIKRQCGLNKVR